MLVVHTGNASCHVRSSCFVVPLSWWLWCHLIHVPAHSWMDKSHLLPWVSPNQVQNILVLVSWTVYTGQLGEAWALETRKTLSFKELILFSKEILQFFPLGSQGLFASSLGFVSKLEGRVWGVHPAVLPSAVPWWEWCCWLGKGWECALHPCQKGFAGSTIKLQTANSQVALSPETN